MIHDSVLARTSLEDAVSYDVANKMATTFLSPTEVRLLILRSPFDVQKCDLWLEALPLSVKFSCRRSNYRLVRCPLLLMECLFAHPAFKPLISTSARCRGVFPVWRDDRMLFVLRRCSAC